MNAYLELSAHRNQLLFQVVTAKAVGEVGSVPIVEGAEGQALLSTLAPLLLTPEDERVIKHILLESRKGQDNHHGQDDELGDQGGYGGH